MEELRRVLKEQVSKYPLMEGQDFLKLIYQNEMAGGHMIKDGPSALSYLEQEALEIEPGARNCDNIGNDIVRMYLCDVKARGIPLSWLNRAFMHTANNRKGSLEALKEKLKVFYEMVEENELPLDKKETEKLLAAYGEMGFPAVHHTEAFRKNYAPHYRVVYRRFEELLPVLERAKKLRDKKQRVVIVIDGRCGSGKSTLSNLLQDVLQCPAVHVDDFFLTPSMRTPERLNEPGGNVNYEYFKETVVDAVNRGRSIKFRPFDCKTMDFKEEITIPESDYLVVEGSYSFHPYFGSYGDIRVFSDIDEEFQRERIINRNGADFAENFFTRWIPMEEKYFDAFKIKYKAEIVITAER